MYINIHKDLNNFDMKTFMYDIMRNIISHTTQGTFNELKEHINDQCFFSNHINHLLKCIITLYTKIHTLYTKC